jgi:TP901 family phage tail tape measure protein
MKGLQSQTKDFTDALGGVGKALTGIGLAGAAGLGAAIKTSADFEAQLSRVGAIAGASSSELDALRQSALELGASTSKSASEVAIAQEGLASLGMTTNEILGAMPGVIAAAEASGSDMAQTAEVMASTLNIFGMEASKASYVADVLAQTANQSAADITDMQYALKYAGPPAAALGVSLEELSASIGIMTDAGMGGENAGTTLRAAMLSLLNPSEKNAKLMNSLGIAVTDASGNFVGLAPLIENLQTSMAGMTDTQKAANLASIVGTEAVSGMLSLMSAGPAEINKMSEALRNSGGASAEAAAKMKDNLKGTIDELQGSFETLMITMGTALTPAIEKVVGVIQGLLDKFNALPQGVQTTIAVIAGIATVFALIAGPVLMFIGMLPQIALGFASLAAGFAKIGPIISAFATGPIGIAIAAIVALVAIFVIAYNKIGWFRDMVNTAWEAIKSAFSTALEFIRGIVESVIGAVVSFAGDQLAKFKAFWDENGSAIMKLVQYNFKKIEIVIVTVMGVIQTIFQTVWPAISGIVKIAWALIKSIIDTAINAVLGIISATMKLMQGDWKGAWETIKKTAETIMKNIIKYFKDIDLVQIGKDMIQGLINGIGSMAKNVGNKVKELAKMIPDGIKSFLDIRSPSKVTFALGEFTGEGFAGGISSMVRDVQSASKGMATAAVPDIPKTRNQSYVHAAAINREESVNVSIAPAPVVIDKRTLGEVVFEVVDEITKRNEIRSRRFGGEPILY